MNKAKRDFVLGVPKNANSENHNTCLKKILEIPKKREREYLRESRIRKHTSMCLVLKFELTFFLLTKIRVYLMFSSEARTSPVT